MTMAPEKPNMPDRESNFDSFKDLLLDMAQERSAEALLEMIVQRLATRPDVALARIWLVAPGDVCDSCPSVGAPCGDRDSCLHMAATAGNLVPQGTDLSQLDSQIDRFPIGTGIVGRIVSTGRRVLMSDIENDTQWVTRPGWAKKEGICGYGGQPLMYGGQTLGALVVFVRVQPTDEGMVWLRMIADHAAVAIANARAFEENKQLKQQLEMERDYLREEVREAHAFGDIIGRGKALQEVLRQVELVAPTDAGVLILGESGTGKELVAREIHRRSPRRERPMVVVNCASIPHELYESEFFGHVRGAFTGAVKDRMGRFELADGGTLFLDEVGEIPLPLQGKLLRVLQEGEFERVGEERTRKVDVRILAATNRDLREETEAQRFRQDLYYRLNVFPLEVAPLRDRLEDIPLLAAHFLKQAAARFNCPQPRLTQAEGLRLQQYDWPGNVRELQNVLERAVITSRSGKLRLDLSSDSIRTPAAASSGTAKEDPLNVVVISDAAMRRRDHDNIRAALEQTNWKIYGPGGAAELLGLRPTTLASRVTRMGLRREQ